jgi:diaminohydroxyphosphoribosylaminopyrimidine deaminase/5-amino-6-(5-phosphoribosylamino)uracil reductase
MAGALLVKDGRIIGEGWHRRCGEAHAEAEAVKAAQAAGLSPAGADLYCTLEPCCFTAPDKRQPPCTALIIRNGIKKVYVANTDPNPRVSGKGVTLLGEAGIEVRAGLCSKEGEELNRAFFTFHRLGRPFVHLKMAQSLDGRIAASDGGARWISGEEARRMVHRLRSFYDAVLIGRGTALADDPELTVRLVKGRNPCRVILDSRLALPETAKLLSLPEPEKTIIIHSDDADERRAAKLRSCGAELLPLKAASGGIPLKKVLAVLGKRGVQSLLVEGGAKIFSSFLREGLWDRLSIFIAPMILGDGVNAVSGLGFAAMEEAMRFKNGAFRRIGSQILFEVDREAGL